MYMYVYIYDIWGMHSEKHKYTHYIKHAYICVHIHILMMVISMMILGSAKGHTVKCSDGLYGEYVYVWDKGLIFNKCIILLYKLNLHI